MLNQKVLNNQMIRIASKLTSIDKLDLTEAELSISNILVACNLCVWAEEDNGVFLKIKK